MPSLRLGPGRELGEDRAALRERLVEPPVLFGIDDVDAARDYPDRSGRERALVRGGVDTACEAGDDDEPGGAELARQLLGEAAPEGRGVAGADDRHRAALEEGRLAFEGQDRRRVGHLREERRILRLAPADEAGADPVQGRELAQRGVPGRNLDPIAGAAPRREARQRLERRASTAEPGEEVVEGDRADPFCAAQPQPLEPLLGAEASPAQGCAVCFLPRSILLSVPARSLRMFWVWRLTTSTAIARMRSARCPSVSAQA